MKQKILILTILMALLLSACASQGQAAATQSAGAQSAAVQGTQEPGDPGGQPGQMPKAMELAIGTLKLESTPNAVSADQAKELLTLWKAVRSLTNSSTAAQKEVDGLFNQIEKAMTAEQIAAIGAMNINMESMAALGEELGFQLGGPQGTPDPGMQATMQAARQTAAAGGDTVSQGGPGGGFGGPPPGGMGGGSGLGGGGPMGSDSSLSDEARATAMAQRGPAGARPGVPPAMLEAIIKLLESK